MGPLFVTPAMRTASRRRAAASWGMRAVVYAEAGAPPPCVMLRRTARLLALTADVARPRVSNRARRSPAPRPSGAPPSRLAVTSSPRLDALRTPPPCSSPLAWRPRVPDSRAVPVVFFRLVLSPTRSAMWQRAHERFGFRPWARAPHVGGPLMGGGRVPLRLSILWPTPMELAAWLHTCSPARRPRPSC